MLMAAKFDMTRLMPAKSESPFEYWISMSPAAPLFGIPWRFADLVHRKDAPSAEAPAPMPPAIELVAETPAKVAETAQAAAEDAADSAKAMTATAGSAAETATEATEAAAEATEAVADAATATAEAAVDDLTAIKGIGPKMAGKLAEEGVTSFRQIAAWTEAEADDIEARIGGVPGCIRRDDWVGQAKTLAG